MVKGNIVGTQFHSEKSGIFEELCRRAEMNGLKILPALDLLEGRIVRLTKGDIRYVKFYDWAGKPIEVAERWIREGADILHIVDMSRTLGLGDNQDLILDMARGLSVQIQVGGGIRDQRTAEYLLRRGIHRIILGTMAFERPRILRRLIDDFGDDRVAVALDYQGRGGKVMVRGWKKHTDWSVSEALSFFKDFGVRFYLLTSIDRDGTMKGLDKETISRVASASREMNIIASGGISEVREISVLSKMGIYGVILGKALYEDKISLKAALAAAGGGEN
ncbi:MAG: 1-(5-phosphoribosyl)-5-((5-phosphoribosylamino)methylideneamino)imidazole-4-carboxamide isomerase [Nitrososphaeria archaeon]|nr:1-(5-phosphoribosyl)-5-((5-phosphoribosylamino)methylideneamino)imidazole-4-carboxamide isomerase [Nitrososphaeria archaeon]NIQ34192.1 1-(5-phosphoribosyl)-5-((5-phosphoribosylamino)methylideneamino)imidazole-4-carboxamide isomerase [Nitrososphaeria archaeon]